MTAGSAASRSQAFRAAITPHVEVAYRFLRRLGVPDHELDDAIQTVLLSANRRFEDIESPAKMKAFIYASCANVARDLGRRRGRVAARTTAIEDIEEPSSSDFGPEEVLDFKEGLAVGERILAKMDDDIRIVFVLYELEELTGAEIAEQLGIPAGTVASRLRKARKVFQETLPRVRKNEDDR